jgi:hypothetical protein
MKFRIKSKKQMTELGKKKKTLESEFYKKKAKFNNKKWQLLYS